MRPEDVDEALKKLEAWDSQLEQAQIFIQSRVVDSSIKSVMKNYER